MKWDENDIGSCTLQFPLNGTLGKYSLQGENKNLLESGLSVRFHD